MSIKLFHIENLWRLLSSFEFQKPSQEICAPIRQKLYIIFCQGVSTICWSFVQLIKKWANAQRNRGERLDLLHQQQQRGCEALANFDWWEIIALIRKYYSLTSRKSTRSLESFSPQVVKLRFVNLSLLIVDNLHNAFDISWVQVEILGFPSFWED